MSTGWIGVDLDGTMAYYGPGSSIDKIGPPIKLMVERVRAWLAAGIEVRVVTARVAECGRANDAGVVDDLEFAKAQHELIWNWTLEHIGTNLHATAQKDFQMIELWDDRCRQVITNTGIAILLDPEP